eukprot:1005522-Prorocentrum_lima.AAC.1
MAICKANAAKRIHTAHQPLSYGHCSLSFCAATTRGLGTGRYNGRDTAIISDWMLSSATEVKRAHLCDIGRAFSFLSEA